MRILGISGSLRRDSHNRRLLLEAAELLPAGVELELFDGLKAAAALRRGRRRASQARPGRAGASRRDRRRRRHPDRDARVQRVRPGPAEERDRLGLAPARQRRSLGNKPVAVIGASTGSLRRRLGAGRAEKILRTAGARVVERRARGPAGARPPRRGRASARRRAVEERLDALLDAPRAGAAGRERRRDSRQLRAVAARLVARLLERAAEIEQAVARGRRVERSSPSARSRSRLDHAPPCSQNAHQPRGHSASLPIARSACSASLHAPEL